MDTDQILNLLEGRWESSDKTAFLFSKTSNWSTLTITPPDGPAFHRELQVIERNGKNYLQVRKDEGAETKEAPLQVVHINQVKLLLDGKELILNRGNFGLR
jgi:hypothetical protein